VNFYKIISANKHGEIRPALLHDDMQPIAGL